MVNKSKIKKIDNKKGTNKKIKKVTNKEIKKDLSDEVKNGTKKETKRLLTSYQTSFLYFLCGACWIMSALLNAVVEENPVFDIIVGILFIIIGVLYLLRGRKEKNAR